jgi:hypothetical protein
MVLIAMSPSRLANETDRYDDIKKEKTGRQPQLAASSISLHDSRGSGSRATAAYRIGHFNEGRNNSCARVARVPPTGLSKDSRAF